MHNAWSALHPRWRPAGFLLGRVSPTLKNWLLDRGSLTERLQHLYGGAFHVELLSQHWGRASVDELKILGLNSRDRVMVREVLLWGGGSPCVFARSILPQRSLKGRLKALLTLDTRPLGAWLFQQNDLIRGPIEVTQCRPSADLPARLREAPPSWGRRSLFFVDGQPLLVAEVFLAPLLGQITAVNSIPERRCP